MLHPWYASPANVVNLATGCKQYEIAKLPSKAALGSALADSLCGIHNILDREDIPVEFKTKKHLHITDSPRVCSVGNWKRATIWSASDAIQSDRGNISMSCMLHEGSPDGSERSHGRNITLCAAVTRRVLCMKHRCHVDLSQVLLAIAQIHFTMKPQLCISLTHCNTALQEIWLTCSSWSFGKYNGQQSSQLSASSPVESSSSLSPGGRFPLYI